MTVHRRLLALVRDPDIPRVCRWALVAGLAIPGPLDEIVIYPAVVAFVWFRRREVLERHGFGGAQVLAAVGVGALLAAVGGLAVEMAMRGAGL